MTYLYKPNRKDELPEEEEEDDGTQKDPNPFEIYNEIDRLFYLEGVGD